MASSSRATRPPPRRASFVYRSDVAGPVAYVALWRHSLVINPFSDVRVGATLSLMAVSTTAGLGWHPFLRDEQSSEDGLSISIVGGGLTVAIDLVDRRAASESALKWVATGSRDRFVQWSRSLSVRWYFHEHYGTRGQQEHPQSSELELKVVLAAEPYLQAAVEPRRYARAGRELLAELLRRLHI